MMLHPSPSKYRDGRESVYHGECRQVMAEMPENSVDAVVTDPPYDLLSVSRNGSGRSNNGTGPFGRTMNAGGFMGMKWDATGVAFDPETWRLALRVLKPGGYLLAFGGARTFHRLACAIEDAGFEVRDSIAWMHGQGFPKSLSLRDIGRPELGTALKPAMELICVARKPLAELNVAANVLKHGTGAINVDGCRIGTSKKTPASPAKQNKGVDGGWGFGEKSASNDGMNPNIGRWPANVVLDSCEEHDGSGECCAAAMLDVQSGKLSVCGGPKLTTHSSGMFGIGQPGAIYQDSGGASRFFYCAKASSRERRGSKHPTVKPLALMRWLVRLVTPPGGLILDPFAGSGTTLEAAMLEGFRAVGIEKEAEYLPDIFRRLNHDQLFDSEATI